MSKKDNTLPLLEEIDKNNKDNKSSDDKKDKNKKKQNETAKEILAKSKESREKKFFRRNYIDNKKLILKCEENNNDHIYVLRSNEGYWKIFNNSALILKNLIGKRNSKRFKLNPDSDHIPAFDGYISIRDWAGFSEIMENEEAVIDGSLSNDFITAFKLKEEINLAEIEGYRNKEKDARQRINDLVKTKYNFPKLSAAVNELVGRIFICYKRNSGRSNWKIYEKLTGPALNFKTAYAKFCNGKMTVEKFTEERDAFYDVLEPMIDVMLSDRIDSVESLSIIADAYSRMKEESSKAIKLVKKEGMPDN